MTEEPTKDLSEPIWFEFSGHKDTQADIEDNVNAISGKRFLEALKTALLSDGWSESTERYDSEVFPEDWGWCVFLRHEEALMMIGSHVLENSDTDTDSYQAYLNLDWIEAGVSITHFHKRSLGDRFRGRNKADPTVHEKAYRSVMSVLKSLSYVRCVSAKHPDDR
ncbi:hypothetical protein QTO30_03770 [Yoonia sp. GPGPB17]|uniref:hypothetical protein n=1 Tax=Yoonia sp. GPGPB17 TaxID=3026147 RepID=UPI0030C33F4D